LLDSIRLNRLVRDDVIQMLSVKDCQCFDVFSVNMRFSIFINDIVDLFGWIE